MMKSKTNMMVDILIALIRLVEIFPGFTHVLNCTVTILKMMIFKRWRYSLRFVDDEI
jgi:hypothetical protein